MLHAIFSCNNGFVVSRHNHCLILESHSCAGSPQVSITTGGDCVRTKCLGILPTAMQPSFYYF